MSTLFPHPASSISPFFFFKVMLSEVLQVLRGAGKVGSALVCTQGEQLRLMACNSTMGAGVKVAQDAVEGLVSNFSGGSSAVRIHHSGPWGLPMCVLILLING